MSVFDRLFPGRNSAPGGRHRAAGRKELRTGPEVGTDSAVRADPPTMSEAGEERAAEPAS
jgi:hypothetical protein